MRGTDAEILVKRVRSEIRRRRERFQYFDKELFADPFWDMMLELFLAELEGKTANVSSLIEASAVSTGTAHRRLQHMVSSGLVKRLEQGKDRRSVHVKLADESFDRLTRFFLSQKWADL